MFDLSNNPKAQWVTIVTLSLLNFDGPDVFFLAPVNHGVGDPHPHPPAHHKLENTNEILTFPRTTYRTRSDVAPYLPQARRGVSHPSDRTTRSRTPSPWAGCTHASRCVGCTCTWWPRGFAPGSSASSKLRAIRTRTFAFKTRKEKIEYSISLYTIFVSKKQLEVGDLLLYWLLRNQQVLILSGKGNHLVLKPGQTSLEVRNRNTTHMNKYQGHWPIVSTANLHLSTC